MSEGLFTIELFDRPSKIDGASHDGHGLQPVFQSPRARVCISPDMPFTRLPSAAGIILGRLFTKTGEPVRAGDLTRIAGSGHSPAILAALAHDHWGGYVALLDHDEDRAALVARDPSGTLSAYYTRTPIGLRLSNKVELLSNHFAIDWPQIIQDLVTEGFRDGKTCLQGIFELTAGTALARSTEGLCIEPYWVPWAYCSQRKAGTFDEVAAHLREIIVDVVGKIINSSQKPLLHMSGGLDSSIVLAALAAHGRHVECLTVATPDPSGDERGQARLVAEHFGFPLHERILATDHVDFVNCVAPHLPRPKRRPLFQSIGHHSRVAARDLDIDIFVSGNGGDQVFSFLQSATPIVDSIRAGQPLLQTLATFENICTLTGCSLGEAVAATWRRYRRPKQYKWTLETALLRDARSVAPPTHSWLDLPAGMLPGKAVHVAMILQMQDHLENFLSDGEVEMATPLMAQPIVEACLAIPSWDWVRGGQNRSVARAAFRDMLPRATVERRVKPGPSSFSALLIETRRGDIRDHLLGGILAREQLIDLKAVSRAIDNAMVQDSATSRRLLELTDVESWCRHWDGQRG